MGALDDIRSALGRARPAKEGHGRVVFIGQSARLSAVAGALFECVAVEAEAVDLEPLLGHVVRFDCDFPGWAIKDVDAAGRWHDVELLPIGTIGERK